MHCVGHDPDLRDPFILDELSSEDLTPIVREKPKAPEPHWSEKFKYDLYDWEDPEWIAKNRGRYAWLPIRLTQGYFMMVSRGDYRRMTKYPKRSKKRALKKRWRVIIHRYPDAPEQIRSIYARRHGYGEGEPDDIPAHRELIGCVNGPGLVDHMNGWGLDNRRGTREEPVNLRYTNMEGNGHNYRRTRKKNPDNLRFPGIEKRREQFGWKICKKVGRKRKNGGRRVVTLRSEETWATQEEAYQGYLKQLALLNSGRENWAHNPTSVNFPVFPRLKSTKMVRARTTQDTAEEHVPF